MQDKITLKRVTLELEDGRIADIPITLIREAIVSVQRFPPPYFEQEERLLTLVLEFSQYTYYTYTENKPELGATVSADP